METMPVVLYCAAITGAIIWLIFFLTLCSVCRSSSHVQNNYNIALPVNLLLGVAQILSERAGQAENDAGKVSPLSHSTKNVEEDMLREIINP